MSQLFQRKPIAELVADTEGAQGLKRSLGAGDLIMLAIGAVIGAGIFGAIGTAAAGQIGSPSCCSAARARSQVSATPSSRR
jgi:basic amino acid/polyamine antiporter, APA family